LILEILVALTVSVLPIKHDH